MHCQAMERNQKKVEDNLEVLRALEVGVARDTSCNAGDPLSAGGVGIFRAARTYHKNIFEHKLEPEETIKHRVCQE